MELGNVGVELCGDLGWNGTWKGPVTSTTWRASIAFWPAFATYTPSVLVNEVTAVFSRTGSLNWVVDADRLSERLSARRSRHADRAPMVGKSCVSSALHWARVLVVDVIE